MRKYILLMAIVASFCVSVQAEEAAKVPVPKTLEYYKQAEALSGLRESRQIGMKEITEMLKDKNTVLLDTRGDENLKWKIILSQ